MNALLFSIWGLIICGNVWLAAGNPHGLAFLASAAVVALAGLAVSYGGIWTREIPWKWWKRKRK